MGINATNDFKPVPEKFSGRFRIEDLQSLSVSPAEHAKKRYSSFGFSLLTGENER